MFGKIINRSSRSVKLVQLMLIVALVGLLHRAHAATPQQTAATTARDDFVRQQVQHGLDIARQAVRVVEQGFESGSRFGMELAASTWNQRQAKDIHSRYVSNISIDPISGDIAVIYNTAPDALPELTDANQIDLTPSIYLAGNYNLLNSSISGTIDWACTGRAFDNAALHGLNMAGGGSVPAKYAPTECQ